MDKEQKLEKALAEVEVTGESKYEVVTGASDTPYLNASMITDGTARNIVTVKITTAKTSFVVDVLKSNPLHRVYKSKNRQKLIDLGNQSGDTPLSEDLLELNYNENREILSQHIVAPPISLEPSETALHIDEIPDDVQELLLGAYEKVCNPRGVVQAVDRFPKGNE